MNVWPPQCFFISFMVKKQKHAMPPSIPPTQEIMAGINCLMINVLPASPSVCGFWLMMERPQGSQVFKDYLLYLQVLSALSQHFNQHTWFTSSSLPFYGVSHHWVFMFMADFIALIFQLTPSALQDKKHFSYWLDKHNFSSVLLEVVVVLITTLSSTQNNKP